MINNQDLIKTFDDLYRVEETAHDYYEELLRMDLSNHALEVIRTIHDDEEKHMLIVKEIIELIKMNLENNKE